MLPLLVSCCSSGACSVLDGGPGFSPTLNVCLAPYNISYPRLQQRISPFSFLRLGLTSRDFLWDSGVLMTLCRGKLLRPLS